MMSMQTFGIYVAFWIMVSAVNVDLWDLIVVGRMGW